MAAAPGHEGTDGRGSGGRSVRLAIERTSDHATAAYVLPLRGGPGGWGNMIAQQDSCVVAEAELLDTGDEPNGPLTKTECVTV